MACNKSRRPYTGTEIKRMAAAWMAGETMPEIGRQFDRSSYSVAAVVRENRDLFPVRRTAGVMGAGSVVVKLATTPQLHAALEAEAKRANKTRNEIVRIALRTYLHSVKAKRDAA